MNRGAVSIKTIIVLVIVVLVGVLSVLGINNVRTYMSGASAGSDPKNVLAKPSDDGKSAIITWSSDKSVSGIVEYGTTPASLLLRAIEPDTVVDHRVSLSPLKSNVNYYFRIRVGEEVFDNNGIPYSFKTKGTVSEMTPSAVTPTSSVLVKPSPAGGCDRTTDYNKDGVTNTVDFVMCMTGKITVAPMVTKTAGVSGEPKECRTDFDYDANGVVNSLDRIKCLQKK
ncbi:fibronectin type III domain-containing protein [Candidatus Shapirobacteria bacterium]|nr:fibronectin type III domain-containing protein [Candidatus Shapirobacteria bacterium]